MWMMIVLSIVKVLYEFGYGFVCCYFGGECYEMGLMILVFILCFYCNVLDVWMLLNCWYRIFILVVGIYVELILVMFCFWGWYFMFLGVLNFVLLSVVFICLVNMLFLNGNLFFCYDGYYILSDLVDVFNFFV